MENTRYYISNYCSNVPICDLLYLLSYETGNKSHMQQIPLVLGLSTDQQCMVFMISDNHLDR